MVEKSFKSEAKILIDSNVKRITLSENNDKLKVSSCLLCYKH